MTEPLSADELAEIAAGLDAAFADDDGEPMYWVVQSAPAPSPSAGSTRTPTP